MQAELLEPSNPRWLHLLEQVRADIYHLPGYVAASARQEGGAPFLFAAVEDGNYWLQPIIIRMIGDEGHGAGPVFDAVSPYGYSGPLSRAAEGQAEEWAARATAAFKACLAARSVVTAFVRLHPLLNRDRAGVSAAEPLTQRGLTVGIDLTESDEQHWHSIRQGHRQNIRRAERNGFTFSIDSVEKMIGTFQEIYSETMLRLGATSYHQELATYFPEVTNRHPDHFHICTVSLGDEVASAGIFTQMDGIVQYHLCATRNKFISDSPSKLMLSRVISAFKAAGNTFFHLGGGRGSDNDHLFQFKAGFSSTFLPYHTWDAVIDPDHYALLNERARLRSPEPHKDIGQFFPKYRAYRTERIGGRAAPSLPPQFDYR